MHVKKLRSPFTLELELRARTCKFESLTDLQDLNILSKCKATMPKVRDQGGNGPIQKQGNISDESMEHS